MASTYTDATGLHKPAKNDRDWHVPLIENIAILDSILGPLSVRAAEIPSTSLKLQVAAGSYQKADGTPGTFPGVSAFAIDDEATRYIYLDATGAVRKAAAWPSTAHIRLAVVVAASGAIASIADVRFLPRMLSATL